MNYATIEDYELRYGTLSGDDKKKVEILLSDSTAIILANGGKKEPTDNKQAYVAVSCAMVHRVVISPSWGSLGVTQHSQTAGSFTESYSFGNPNGDLYLTKSEKRTLGLTSMKIGTIAPLSRGDRQ